jgi:protein ImuB
MLASQLTPVTRLNPLLASVQKPSTRTPTRILALYLEENAANGQRNQRKVAAKVAEIFLRFSPRVHIRTTNDPAVFWLFLDVASTSHLFQGEEILVSSATLLARELGFGVKSAVADTPAGAQAFAIAQSICPPGEEKERLKDLSLPSLLHLEGLQSWAKPSAIESIVTFFLMLGFKNVGELSRFTMASFQERWGETGVTLWRRLHALEKSVISPLIPVEPLEDYMHLDFPISLVSLLLHQVSKSTTFLFARLHGRRQLVQKMTLILHCEYAKTQHKIEIEPNTPSRDPELFATLLENRLSALELENPIRDFELHIVPNSENSRQFDFFEPRDRDGDKLQILMSLLSQSSIKLGHFEIAPSIVPEKSWRVVNHVPLREVPDNHINASLPMKRGRVSETEAAYEAAAPRAIAPQPMYGTAVLGAPRPSRILNRPLPLTLDELQNMKVLSSTPIERLEAHWWSDEAYRMMRDYYFAISDTGQCLWIYQDLRSQEYFLHGYFD